MATESATSSVTYLGLQEELERQERKTTRYVALANTLEISTLVLAGGAALLTSLAAIDQTIVANTIPPVIAFFAFVASGISKGYEFREKAARHRSAKRELRNARTLYDANAGPYQGLGDDAKDQTLGVSIAATRDGLT